MHLLVAGGDRLQFCDQTLELLNLRVRLLFLPCRALPPRRRKVMVEYVLLGGCNDRPADADDLAAFLRPIEAACADPARASRRTGDPGDFAISYMIWPAMCAAVLS